MVLRVHEISTGYNKKQTLFRVTMHVGAGEIVSVIGPNGAGKSTLIKAVMGFVKLWGGSVSYNGFQLNGVRPHHRVRLGIGYIPQGRPVFSGLTVQEHLELAARLLGKNKRSMIERVYDLLPILFERRRQRADSLSGGERQILALGRTLLMDPKLLVLDEPAAGLSVRMADRVFQELERMHSLLGVSALVVEHNLQVALSYSGRTYVLVMGKVHFEGPSSQLLNDPALLANLFIGQTSP